MSEAGDPLAGLAGGRVLDVATGTGGFVRALLERLGSHVEIVGIDANPARREAFEGAFGDVAGVRFEQMDAHALAFDDASFDTVAVSNSLHHFADPVPVFAEMRRVLRPGGHFIVNEMFRDGQSATQLTHVELHHWWAAVGRLVGEIHRETYERAQIVALVAELGLDDLVFADEADPAADPFDPEEIAGLDGAIEQYLEKAAGHPELQARGRALRDRLHSIGVHGATQLLGVGRRPM